MPLVFGPFSKVWDELGSFDLKISSLRSAPLQSEVCSISTGDELDSLPSEPEIEAEDADEPAAEMSEENEVQDYVESHEPLALPEVVRYNPVGRFSEVWDQINNLDFVQQGSERGNINILEQTLGITHRCLRVVNIAGNSVGDFDISPGMSVSTLKDKIAASQGELPFTLTLLWETEVLNDTFDLSEIARQCALNDSPLTLLHSAPSVGSGSFSKVWDALGKVDASLGNFGTNIQIRDSVQGL